MKLKIFACIILLLFNKLAHTQKSYYYPFIEQDSAINIYFGDTVLDLYRNIENMSLNYVQEWFKAQRVFHDSIMNLIKARDSLKNEIEKYYYSSTIRGNLPRICEDKLFFVRYYAKEKLSILYYKTLKDTNLIELFSTKDIDKKEFGDFTIDFFEPSFDGKYMAFGYSYRGNENTELHIIDVEKRKILKEKIERTSSGSPQWLNDNSGFFYFQLQESDKNKQTKRFENSAMKLHLLNTKPQEDIEVFSKKVTLQLSFENIDFPRLYTYPGSDIIVGAIYHGTGSYVDLYYSKLNELLTKNPDEVNWKKIFDSDEKVSEFILINDKVIALGFDENLNGQLFEASINNFHNKKVLYEGNENVLYEIALTKDYFYLSFIKNGIYNLLRFNNNDYEYKKVNLPFNGTIELTPNYPGSPYHQNSNCLVLGLSTWINEWGAYLYCPPQDTILRLNTRPYGDYGNPDNLIVNEMEILSHDSLLIPLTVIHDSKTQMDGSNPTLLFAYGAYGRSIEPSFNTALLAWLNNGGIYAIAHVRGGGEKGENWRLGGYKATKPNSWKDLISCSEYLINNKFTSAGHLAIMGGSAGAITIGRAITERPELFKAAIITVGVANVLRHEERSNTVNTEEYGSVRDSIEYKYLYEMDFYHHIKEGNIYPSILFTAGFRDARVEPWQPGKAVAKLQNQCNTDNITLFRVTNEGHFGDSKYTEYMADLYSFLFWQLGKNSFSLRNNIQE